MTHILHLSDLHFGGGHHFAQDDAERQARPTLAKAVADALERSGSPDVDLLVLSGDLLSNDQSNDRDRAKQGLEELIGALGIQPRQVLCVPGNHDLTWAPDRRDEKFYFYDEVVDGVKATGASDELPRVVPVTGEGSERPLAFVLMNSCLIENQELAGLGEIGEQQLEGVQRAMAESGVSKSTHTIVAVVHHHLLPVLPRERLHDRNRPEQGPIQGPSLMLDAVAALQRFAEMGVLLVLHGHRHRSAVLHYEDALDGVPPVRIVAAGSCGARGGAHRHFFSIQTTADRVLVSSFDESDRNGDRFELAPTKTVNVLRTPKRVLAVGSDRAPAGGDAPLPMLEDYCPADAEGRELDVQIDGAQDRDGLGITEDRSDLNVVMFSVSDCPTARKELRRAIAELPTQSLWRHGGQRQVWLLGMYDLLGYWDLAVRLRIGNGVDPRWIIDYLDAWLRDVKLRSRDDGLFSRRVTLDVRREASSIRELLVSGREPIERRVLGDTADYERLRCQRSFVWIDLGSEQDRILDQLATAVEKDPHAAAIIESASLGDQVLLLETFSACGQSSEIARLNRVIEPVLARWACQKYTLTCYGYDEEPLIPAEPVPA
jgi:predicted phosphodiesterase